MAGGELAAIAFDLVFEYESAVFSLDTIKRTVYKFSALGTFDIRSIDRGYRVYFSATVSMAAEGAEQFRQRFQAEIVDQDLRETIKQETEKVRLLILANAFSRTKLID